ncbi:alpha amylase C-terminal domain-containing protein [Litoribacter ruber]|uniref:alpha-amylase family glycosyl hydrolase n=1 Tax=Litoribacter ruber TaxID=702568 RepID=UPI001BD97572|nr:alpha-amylase family glycosyl hydrolase [Litoribacter ruber]MBT0810520.1 alpha amylase C-terminal domain-containing protein [Litoribacter ruber]
MGASLHEEGCFFKLWAPHAQSVHVIGDFNDWKPGEPLEKDDHGIWQGSIRNAQEGQEYRYLLNKGDQEFSRIDPYAKEVTHSMGNSVICTPLPPIGHFDPPPLHQAIIYELHVGTFYKTSEEGPGTFADVIEKLDYLQELGVNIIKVMPVHEFAGSFSWGYNPSHLFAVETSYGGRKEFRKLIDEAHTRGIAVVLDVVYNHWGPTDLDLWRFDGWYEGEGGGIFFYNDDRGETPWGHTRPDFGRPEVRKFIFDNVMFWLNEIGVDGLRWDGTALIRNCKGEEHLKDQDLADGWSLMQWANEESRKVKPKVILIAEDVRGNGTLTEKTEEGGAGFDAQWNSIFVEHIKPSLADDAQWHMDQVIEALEFRYKHNAFERIVFSESHDAVAIEDQRLPEEASPGQADSWIAKKKSALGAVLTMTAPGIPMIFQGQEFLKAGAFDEKDFINWDRLEQRKGIFKLYQDLISLRLNKEHKSHALSGQHIEILHAHAEIRVVTYKRWADNADEAVYVIINFSQDTHEDYWLPFPGEGDWVTIFNSDSKIYDEEFGNLGPTKLEVLQDEEGNSSHSIILPPYSAIIMYRE